MADPVAEAADPRQVFTGHLAACRQRAPTRSAPPSIPPRHDLGPATLRPRPSRPTTPCLPFPATATTRPPPPPRDRLLPSGLHCVHLGAGAPSCAAVPRAEPSRPVASTACAWEQAVDDAVKRQREHAVVGKFRPKWRTARLMASRWMFSLQDWHKTECRIVPEYSFLDARGLGSFEGKSLDTLPEVLVSVHYIMNKLSLQSRITRIYGSTRAVSLIGTTFLITIQLGYSMFSGSNAGLTASS